MTRQNTKETTSTRLDLAIATADSIDGQLKAFTCRPASYPSGNDIGSDGALRGVPVAVKDLIDTADMPTAYGSKIFQGHQPRKDAWIVNKLREAGAVIFGKTVTTEFAWRDPGATVNPWNPAHSPGGSSSGSAAAVGAGIVDIALGTQTVGSVIRPASYCGAVGYKPTYGRIPTEGVHPLAPTLDHLGFITSSFHWAAVCHAIVVQDRPFDVSADAFARGEKPRRIGIYRSSQWAHVDSEVQQNFDATVRRLEFCGVECVDVDLGMDIRDINALTNGILAYEARQSLYGDIKDAGELAGPYTRELVKRGETVSDDDYANLIGQIKQARATRDAPLRNLDAIMTITSPTTALKGLEKTGDASFCAPATLLGLPAVTVPSGISTAFLPFGVQLIGRANEDLALLNIGQWFSNVLPSIRAPSLTFTAS
ncbi:amidase [Herbaspirillum sp. RV1423]|uniref:amidase n=1 Tax=Herbaspirillum sp. RV1423 TaxID=1443993 RepID=UPI0005589909|nr:amidase [Herbaspirillum sp. RV1423]